MSMLSRECSAPLRVTHWVSHRLPILSSFSQFYFSHLCAPLGGIHLVSISKLPPLVPLSNFLHSFTWSQDFTSGLLTPFCMHLNLVSMSRLPPLSLTTSCAHLVSISNFPPVPLIKLPKLPAFICFQYLYFPRSLPKTSCVHFVLISKLPSRCPSTTSCIHLASIFPVPLSNFLHSSCFNIPGAPQQLPAFVCFYIWFLTRHGDLTYVLSPCWLLP